jgi:hypothetical protein
LALAQDSLAGRIDERLSAASQRIRTGCGAELQKYCEGGTPGENGRPGEDGMILCIVAHRRDLGLKCSATLYQVSRNLERTIAGLAEVANACWTDIETKCSGMSFAGGRIARCLASEKTALTAPCQGAIEKLSLGP